MAAGAVGPSCLGKKATMTGSGTIIGTDANDVIVGSDGADTINGRGGDDLICALGGDDTIAGGLGDDRIDAGDGNDSVRGDVLAIGVDAVGGGNDVVHGDAGRDLIAGDSFSVGANAISSSRARVPERDLPRCTQKELCPRTQFQMRTPSGTSIRGTWPQRGRANSWIGFSGSKCTSATGMNPIAR